MQKNLEELRNNIKTCIRLHQAHVIDPKWCEAPIEVKTNIYTALKAVENIVREDAANFKEFGYLQATHYNAWKGKDVQPILSGKPDFKSTDYFNLECPEICMKRLSVLVETRLDLMAYNFADFLVKNLFDQIKKRNNVLLVKWLESATTVIINNIFDIYVNLLFKLKKDSILLYPTLKLLSIDEVLCAIDRWSQRNQDNANGVSSEFINGSDPLCKTWIKPLCSKIEQALCDYCMIYAAKCELKLDLVKRIVSKWLRLFPDGNDSNLDIDVEKYVSLGGKTAQIYEIGYQLYSKYGDCRRQLCIEQFIRGLSYDLNIKEVALTKKDHPTVKQAEYSISFGLQYLAKVMQEHLPVVRECLLTAFSLTPTEVLLKEIREVAEKSGFLHDENDSLDIHMDEGTDDRIRDFQTMNFDTEVDNFISNLEKGSYMRTSYSGKLKDEKKKRNLDALISIQGDLITEAANYDPVAAPMPSFTAQKLKLHPRIVADLLICINSSRWHLLSWVMDWPTLEQKCKLLLENPEIRKQDTELKYLVIDYTQFDEWSSEEELLAQTGIEKGYEEWDNFSSGDEQPVEEKGLDDDEGLDFNVMPRLVDQEGQEVDDDLFDDYILPKDYLPKRLASLSNDVEMITKGEREKTTEENITFTENKKISETFLGRVEETTASCNESDKAQSMPAETLLQSTSSALNSTENLTESTKVHSESVNQLICNRLEILRQNAPLNFSKEDQVRWLKNVVPGLDGDLSFLDPANIGMADKMEISLDVFVVHVTTPNAKVSSRNLGTTSQSSSPGQSQAQNIQINGTSNTEMSSATSSNSPSSTKTNGFSSHGSQEKNSQEATLPAKNHGPHSSSISENNATKVKSSPPTKTSSKPKRKAAINKASQGSSPSKITVSRVIGTMPKTNDNRDTQDTIAQPQVTSSSTAATSKNATSIAISSNLPKLQINSVESPLPQQSAVTHVAQPIHSILSRDQPQQKETKVQYIYKQGGQTVIIDYPMAEDTIARLKPVPIIQQQSKQPNQQIRLPIVLSNSAGTGSPQKMITQRISTATSVGNQNATTAIVLPSNPPKIILSSAQSPSVDTLANSLISQIQTPINQTNQNQSPRVAPQQSSISQAHSASSLPKFQFAFGNSGVTRRVSTGAVGGQQQDLIPRAQLSKGKTEGSNVVGNSPQNISINGGGQQFVMKQVTLPLASGSGHSPQILGTQGHIIQLQKSPSSDLIPGKLILTQASPQAAAQIKQQINPQQRCIVQSGGTGVSLGGVTISKPQPTQINAIIQKLTPVTTVQQQLASRGKLTQAMLPQVGSTVPLLSQGSVTSPQSSSSAPATPTSSLNSGSSNQVDLIRQLNMARAQGLVVLQQWGDKQVLVHKATGRWIMRQGNRLVTVPPQALGITPSGISSGGNLNPLQKQIGTVVASGSPTKQWIQANIAGRGVTTAQGSPTILQAGMSSKPGSQLLARLTSGSPLEKQESIQVNLSNSKPSMSSSTMEQLAEFDSILESKFKSLSPSPALPSTIQDDKEENSSNVMAATTPVKIEGNTQNIAQSPSRTSAPGPTFVILQPTSKMTMASSTSVIVTSASSTSSQKLNKTQSIGKITIESAHNQNVDKIPSSASSTSSRGSSSNRSPSPSPITTVNKNSNGIRLLSTSAPSSPAKYTIATPPMAPNPTCSSASASPASSTSSVSSSFIKPPPKPQEDPDTLKRIQQILDDYNEQIRNSPDLQNRPAPRRRTNGVPSATSSSVISYSTTTSNNASSPVMSPISSSAMNGNNITTLAKKKRNVLGTGSKSDLDSSETPSILQLASASAVEPSHILGTPKSVSKTISITEAHNSLTPSPVAPPPNLKPVVRQIMVPPSLAASLQASGRQLMVVTGPGGKKMVALKPLIIPQGNGVSNNGNSPIRIQAPSHSSSKSSSSSITVGPPGASVAIEADDYHHGSSTEDDEEAGGNGISVNLGRPSQSDSPCSGISSQSIALTSSNQHSGASGSPMSSNNQSLPASPIDTRVSDSTSLTSKLDTDHLPSSPSMGAIGLEMPLDTQSMGIPIEMTPGQIMEAEMSATGSFLDDVVEATAASNVSNMNEFFNTRPHSSPQHLLRSSRGSLGGSEHDTLSHAEQETLPENVFNPDFHSDTNTPSPKLTDAHHDAKSSTFNLMNEIESEIHPTKENVEADEFSLDDIVSSIGDPSDAYKDHGLDNCSNDRASSEIDNHEHLKIERLKKKNENKPGNFNNNQMQKQHEEGKAVKVSTRQRKRNLSPTIANNETGIDTSNASFVNTSSLPKRTRLQRQGEEMQQQPTVVSSSVRTRQQRNSMGKNKSKSELNEEKADETNTKSSYDQGEEDEYSSFLNDDIQNAAPHISLRSTPFSGITTTGLSHVVGGDFNL